MRTNRRGHRSFACLSCLWERGSPTLYGFLLLSALRGREFSALCGLLRLGLGSFNARAKLGLGDETRLLLRDYFLKAKTQRANTKLSKACMQGAGCEVFSPGLENKSPKEFVSAVDLFFKRTSTTEMPQGFKAK